MALLTQDEINDIRGKSNIVDIIGSYIPLTNKGKNYFCVCPFHDDHAPSMSVSNEKQIYKCFSCGASGNVFTFVQNYENVSFLEAIKIVVAKSGQTISKNLDVKESNRYKEQHEIMEIAGKFYQNNLKTSFGSTAREYLTKRQISEEIINEFELGLSLDNKDTLTSALLKKGYSVEMLSSLGLSNIGEYGSYDVFSKRIMIPIHDPSGKVVAFTGRIYKTDDTSKYVNSKETIIFKKGQILYNYHNAKDVARKMREIILVEGNMDAIRIATNGIKNVVALMGTSMTDNQADLLKKLNSRIILCLDNDDAGRRATVTIGQILEKKGMDVSVISLSDAKDPDEYIVSKGLEAFKENLKSPLKYFEYNLNYLKSNKDLNKAEDLANYVNEVLKSLNEVEDDILKETTILKLNKDYGISLDTLRSKISGFKKKEIIEGPVLEKKVLKHKEQIAAEKILYFMLNDARYIRYFKKQLGYLENATYRAIANEITYYENIHGDIDMADFITYASDKENIREKVMDIINEGTEEEINQETFEEYIAVIKKCMTLNEIKELKNEIKHELDESKKLDLIKRLTELKKEV